MIIDNCSIDIVGLENAFKALNDLQERHPDLLRQGCSEFVDSIRDNLTGDVAKLHILLQHDAIQLSKIDGLINECMRFINLFNIDSVRGCDVNFIAAIIQLGRNVRLMFDFVQGQTNNLLNKCMTDRATKYFNRAINVGWMEKTTNGYKWKWGEPRGKARLGYFLKNIYNPDGCNHIPYKGLENLFGVKRLDISIDQTMIAKNPQKWREEIDDKIFYD